MAAETLAETLEVAGNAARRTACSRLRRKGMFIDVAPDPHVPGPGDGFCWCSHTMTCLGPDGRVADEARCGDGRRCFEAL